MLGHLKKYYRDPFYRNSLALMLNSAFSAFFGLLFWIVAARTLPSKDIGLATAAISAAGLIMGLSRLGLDSGLVGLGGGNAVGVYIECFNTYIIRPNLKK
jgi:O-antigen/teichoic acid export membrane protein